MRHLAGGEKMEKDAVDTMETATDINDSRKRKSIHLTAEEKLEILKKVDDGLPVSMIANVHNLAPTNIYRWMKDRQSIEECRSRGPKSKQIRSTRNEEVNNELHKWFLEMRNRGLPVSGPCLKVKALELHEKLGGSDRFLASEGWLNKWKLKYGIHLSWKLEEKESANTSVAEDFKTNFENWIEIENLKRCQIFNADETILNFKSMPNELPTSKTGKELPSMISSRDRVTIMPCCNADGSLKLPLLVVGSSAEPQSLKDVSKEDLPVWYASHRKSMLTREIFEDWMRDEFIPNVTQFLQYKGLPPKAVLLLNNAPSHPASEILSVGDFMVVFLPSEVTSLIQPMSNGIIANLKKRYRWWFSTSILNSQVEKVSVTDKLKSITTKDVVFWLSEAWDGIVPLSISKSWNSLLSELESLNKLESLQEVMTESIVKILRRLVDYKGVRAETVKDWLINDEDYPLEESLMDETTKKCKTENGDLEDGEESVPEKVPVSIEDAELGIANVIQFLEQNKLASKTDMTCLRKLQNKIIARKLNV